MAKSYPQKRTRNVLQCRHCGHMAMARASRHGFWQSRVLPVFGLYPWQCMTCGAQALLRDRGLVNQADPGVWNRPNSVAGTTNGS
jgi:DNA-directed RNA polymerase subunit RPC12/RpoP